MQPGDGETAITGEVTLQFLIHLSGGEGRGPGFTKVYAPPIRGCSLLREVTAIRWLSLLSQVRSQLTVLAFFAFFKKMHFLLFTSLSKEARWVE